MRLLLDTHTALWWLFDSSELSATCRALIADRANLLHVSSASVWEICTKYRLGKLPGARNLMQDLPGYLERAGFTELPIRHAHAELAGSLPSPHRDPFDRVLVAQARIEGLTLLSRDQLLAGLGASVRW